MSKTHVLNSAETSISILNRGEKNLILIENIYQTNDLDPVLYALFSHYLVINISGCVISIQVMKCI